MTDFLLVRHGQTDWNAARLYQGQADIPLNNTGIAQAHSLALQVAGQTFAALYASDLKRAVLTAEILAQPLGLKINIDVRLREICQGAWEGLSFDEVQEKYAEDFRHGFEDPTYSRAPGGESVAEVAARMAVAANDIARLHPEGRVLIVSHGLAVATLYCQANGIALNEVYHHIPDNAVPLSISWPPRDKTCAHNP